MFQKIFIVVVTVLVPAIAGAQQTAAAKAKQIEGMERAVYVAIQKGDVNAFKAILAAEAVVMDGSGAMPIAEFLKTFKPVQADEVRPRAGEGELSQRHGGRHDLQVDRHRHDDGAARAQPGLGIDVYVLRAGKWQVVFHQESVATPAPPPAKKQ